MNGMTEWKNTVVLWLVHEWATTWTILCPILHHSHQDIDLALGAV